MVHYLALRRLRSTVLLDTPSGKLNGRFIRPGITRVQQGKPKLTTNKPLDLAEFGMAGVTAYPVDIGNPHLVVLGCTDNHLESLEAFGSRLEHHPFFPNRCNVEFCQVLPPSIANENGSDLVLRVMMWERGAGRTSACGSGACAAAAAAVAARNFGGKGAAALVLVEMEGGILRVIIDEDGTATHEGEARFVYRGAIPMHL